jgi:hypothetical protein
MATFGQYKFEMKNFIAISVTKGGGRELEELVEAINRILCTPLHKDIFIYDVSIEGVHKETEKLLRSYNRYGVFYKRQKKGKSFPDTPEGNNERINFSIAQSLLDFNMIKSNKYSVYIHLNQNMIFDGFDLQLLADNAQLYSALSPVIENVNGIEILSALFDRWGTEYFPLDELTTYHITGAVEESYTLNPKCFALSKRYANRLRDFTFSHRDPVSYLNELVYNHGGKMPKIDTQLFVHENLY